MAEFRWYKKHGFSENPFSIKPYDSQLFGANAVVGELRYRIDSGTMSFLEGGLGTGKTSVLKALIGIYKGNRQVIYFAANRIDKKLNVEELLRGRNGVVGKLLNVKPKNMILLLDECQEMSRVNTERIKNYFDQDYIKSVVFTGTNFKEVKFHPSIISRIGEQGVVRMNVLGYDDAIRIYKNRVGSFDILDDAAIKKIFMKAEKNPRRFLHYCDAVCRYAFEKKKEQLSSADVDSALSRVRTAINQ